MGGGYDVKSLRVKTEEMIIPVVLPKIQTDRTVYSTKTDEVNKKIL